MFACTQYVQCIIRQTNSGLPEHKRLPPEDQTSLFGRTEALIQTKWTGVTVRPEDGGREIVCDRNNALNGEENINKVRRSLKGICRFNPKCSCRWGAEMWVVGSRVYVFVPCFCVRVELPERLG